MKILIISRQSKYEWERDNYNLSHKNFIDKYGSKHSDLKNLLNSHYELIKTRKIFESAMPNADMMLMSELKYPIKDCDLVISLGGDDNFKYISHYVENIPILSINSDPQRSVGALTSCSVFSKNSVLRIKECLNSNKFKIEEWAKLKIVLNGLEIMPAASEYFLGDSRRNKMSAHTLIYKGKEYQQKCSGLIVATGAGSTGWFKSATDINSFSPTSKSAWFVATELYDKSSNHACNFGFIYPDEELIIRSMNKEGGIISVDSWKDYEFTRGSEAVVSLGDLLKVIVLNESI